MHKLEHLYAEGGEVMDELIFKTLKADAKKKMLEGNRMAKVVTEANEIVKKELWFLKFVPGMICLLPKITSALINKAIGLAVGKLVDRVFGAAFQALEALGNLVSGEGGKATDAATDVALVDSGTLHDNDLESIKLEQVEHASVLTRFSASPSPRDASNAGAEFLCASCIFGNPDEEESD